MADDLAAPSVVTYRRLGREIFDLGRLSGEQARYRLLDATRLYALEKLRSGGEHQEAARRRAPGTQPPIRRIIRLNPAAQYGTTCAFPLGKATMSFKSPSFGDRMSASTKAKKAALERFRVNSADPAAAERQAAREAAQIARDARDTERRTARREAEARAAAEQAAEEAARVTEQAAREAALARQAAHELAKEAERRAAILSKASAKAQTDTALLDAQKAARDARYAARKARK